MEDLYHKIKKKKSRTCIPSYRVAVKLILLVITVVHERNLLEKWGALRG
jgi:hypothetical protein